MADVSLEDFEQEARQFLAANAARKARQEEPFRWGDGPEAVTFMKEAVALMQESERDDELEEIADARAWRAKRFDAGLGWITGPRKYGGRELSVEYEQLYTSLEADYQVPADHFLIGLQMVAPTILAHGIAEAKERYLPRLFRGDIIACQLFSEPGAGSDLAGLQTRAQRDGDEWVITGQKVWTSAAHYSDIGEILCRTDPDRPKHHGITAFIVDMQDPGIEVRPLRQMTGGASFNEVFLNEVRVPDSHRLGEVNEGWGVARTTLMNERAALGGGEGFAAMGELIHTHVAAMPYHLGIDPGPTYRDELMQLYTAFAVAEYTNRRMMSAVRAGKAPGPELTVGKLALARNLQRAAALVSRVLGPRITADTNEWGTFAWNLFILGAPSVRVGGGTDEVLRNILAERVLGLPREPAI